MVSSLPLGERAESGRLYAEVHHYIANIENQNQLVPKFIQTPWMIKGAGVLYGVK